MKLIPVLDVLHGRVVRGVGGRRSEYRPIVSRLTSSTDPVEVARALINTFHPSEVYLADLDALRGARWNTDTYRGIRDMGVRLWVDAGIGDVSGASLIAETGCHVVAGLETVRWPEMLGEIVGAVSEDRVVLSLDLKDGVPIRTWPTLDEHPPWPNDSGAPETVVSYHSAPRPKLASDPRAIAAEAIQFGITRLIVLDLARVGGGLGTGTEDLCRQLADTYPHVEFIAGGGIAGPADLDGLAACGVRGVLVASALHDGRIGPDTVSRLSK